MFADAGSVTGQGVLNPFPRFKMVSNGTAVLKTLPTGLFLLASWVAKTLQLGCKISPARVAKIPWLSSCSPDMGIWKCWKRVRTRFKNLQRCGIAKWQSWQWANTRKGYWCTVHSPILTRAISNENLKRAHYPTLTEYYEKMHPR